CTGCGAFCEYQVVLSNEKENQGHIMVACNCVKDGKKCAFFQWKQGSMRSPMALPIPPSVPTLPNTPTLDATPPAPHPTVIDVPHQDLYPVASGSITDVCPTTGCKQMRTHVACPRHLCRKHCVAAGGCSLRSHMIAGKSSGLQAAITVATASLLEDSADAAAITSLQVPQEVPIVSSLGRPSSSLTTPASSSLLAPFRPKTESMLHVTIFTEQYGHEQQLQEKNRVVEAECQCCPKLSKQVVVINSWHEDNEPPAILELQEGFSWPYLVLTADVLANLELDTPCLVQLYRQDLGTWLNIKPGHLITVKKGDHVFLKARNVKNYQDFDRHLK
ncbi:hypothetical protein L208DRAFT_1223569, partial [Tricholoma matsutake]